MKSAADSLLYLLQLIRENPIEFPAPGLGLGASDNARRWATLGMIIDNEINWSILEKSIVSYSVGSKPDFESRNKVGRPDKGILGSKDCWRAFTLWRLRRQFPQYKTVKSLVELASQMEKILKIEANECGFYLANCDNIAQSVSRGKNALDIDRSWHSETCEKLEAI